MNRLPITVLAWYPFVLPLTRPKQVGGQYDILLPTQSGIDILTIELPTPLASGVADAARIFEVSLFSVFSYYCLVLLQRYKKVFIYQT